jgi:hypothetical protein
LPNPSGDYRLTRLVKSRARKAGPTLDYPGVTKERIMAKGNNSQGKDKKKAKAKPKKAGKAKAASQAKR